MEPIAPPPEPSPQIEVLLSRTQQSQQPSTQPAKPSGPSPHHSATPPPQQLVPSLHHSVTPSPQSSARAWKPKTRNGKIARLPYPERDMVNRMLRDNIPHEKIVDALAELGLTVTQRNISNWKTRGGYREWCLEQERALETRLLQDNLTEHLRQNQASQLPEVGLQIAATHLSQFFLKSETQHQLASEPEKCARTIAILCRLARQIHILQKYRDESAKGPDGEDHPERVKREDEHEVELTRELYSAASIGERSDDPIIHRRNYLPKS